MAAYKNRIERLVQLAVLISRPRRSEDCPDVRQLLELLAECYASHATPSARLRALQRDLDELVRDGRIEAVNPGGKPLRFRGSQDKPESDPYLWNYACQTMRALIRDSLPVRSLEPVWRHLLNTDNEFGLGEDKLRILADSQRLLLADIHDTVLPDVLVALATSCTLEVGYRDAQGKVTAPVLHPQALLQRGPRVYLFALKNDEVEPVRMYALHRFTRSVVGKDAARKAEHFDLQTQIDGGQADFGDGKEIALVLRVRGYVADLLRDCPLGDTQLIEDEDEGSPFELRACVTIPATGQLLRWLLGCGDNVEVIGPPSLRKVMAAQTNKTAALYDRRASLPDGGGAAGVRFNSTTSRSDG